MQTSKSRLYRHGSIEEKITDLEAGSWNMKDGKPVQTALGKSNHYEVRENEYWMNHKIAMPDVKPGTIIEYHYITPVGLSDELQGLEISVRYPDFIQQFRS